MEFGNKLLELRKSKGFSQEQLAEKLNVTRQTISNWELGQTIPDINQAKKIANIFCISLDELVDNDIQDILVQKISNTERLAGITIKILKVIGISLAALLIIAITCGLAFVINETTVWISNLEPVGMLTTTFPDDSPYAKGETAIEMYCCTFGKHFKYIYDFEYNVADHKLVSMGRSTYYLMNRKEGEELDNFDFKELEEVLNDASRKINTPESYDVRQIKKVIEEYFTKIGGTWENTRYTFEDTGSIVSYKVYND